MPTGTVTAIRGSVVDVRFDDPPPIHTLLRAKNGEVAEKHIQVRRDSSGARQRRRGGYAVERRTGH